MKTAPTNKKVRELIGMVKEEKLLPRPEFQRRLVWTHKDKNHFLDSILRGYPFPEIYLADGDVDLESGTGTQLLVDGLQRVNTMIEYFEGSPNLRLLTVPAYKDLDEERKRSFLQYDVAVRDLGLIERDQIVEVFKRINATKYSLLDIEINNAVYSGALKQFAESVAAWNFFEEHSVFNARDYKRMGDLRFALLVIVTLITGYFNRDDDFEPALERYNDEFPPDSEITSILEKTLAFIDECGFPKSSRIWKKADLFTLIIELSAILESDLEISPSQVIERLDCFFSQVNEGLEGSAAGIYYKASLQATNDRINRIRRGFIIDHILRGEKEATILALMAGAGLLEGRSPRSKPEDPASSNGELRFDL